MKKTILLTKNLTEALKKELIEDDKFEIISDEEINSTPIYKKMIKELEKGINKNCIRIKITDAEYEFVHSILDIKVVSINKGRIIVGGYFGLYSWENTRYLAGGVCKTKKL